MTYTVVAGDTFWAISQKLHISLDSLIAANSGVNINNLQIGQVLKVPGNGPTDTFKYIIKMGDTLWSIAQSYGSSVAAIQAVNPGINANALQIGQIINVPTKSNAPIADNAPTIGSGYVAYSGPASNYPSVSSWASWDKLWTNNLRLLKMHDSDSEIAFIKSAIQQVSAESGVDPRVILCIIVQESGGNVRVPTTYNGVRNPGLMQSHNGVEFNPNDPAGSILQMIRDGTSGTRDGPGLKQLYVQYGNYYAAFRAYNSGSVNAADLNDPVGATGSYVQAVANRLMGHVWDGM